MIGRTSVQVSVGNQVFTHAFYVGNIQDSCIIGLDLFEHECVVVDIVAGKLHTNFGTVVLSKSERALCLTPPPVRECMDTDAAIERKRQAVDELLERSSSGLTSEQQTELCSLVDEFTEIFATEAYDCTHTNIVQHEINTEDALPI